MTAATSGRILVASSDPAAAEEAITGTALVADGHVVDGKVAFMGSQNMIDSSYILPANLKVGRHWKDLNVKISGEIIMELEAVFAMDWYTETGERLGLELELVNDPEVDPVPMQLLPSEPGYLTIPNLRLITGLVHRAQEKL